eukprot:Plantae.Rhodophyta-Hildenbrandia_rubra.ctg373.p1 GENE.Plantae.Rhodophyta-Hildenbrandia_rubra.ctg373~~Plantae.Rhodophyta-Hildenbrandia_rubra.ctg373.p1  ORF type:complete len:385 (-),score=45.29 Plantae.Rhodophyta-Hildenbrandia_rubra.ctg373:1790-2944(-)
MSLLFPGTIDDAIAHCRERSSLLIVLVRPAAQPKPSPDETLHAKYSRVADSSLSRHTLSSPLVRGAVSDARAAFLQLRDGTPDFASFSQLFRAEKLPSLFIISPGEGGAVLVRKEGFVSPAAFVGCLNYAQAAQGKSRETILATTLALVASASKKTSTETTPTRNLKRCEKPSKDHSIGKTSTTSSVSSSQCLASKTPFTERSSRCALVIRLPDGTVSRVTFSSNEHFSVVREHVSGRVHGSFRLCTAFPRRTFDAADDSKELGELDLAPSATLVVTREGRDRAVIGWNGVNSAGRGARKILDTLMGVMVGMWKYIRSLGGRSGNGARGGSTNRRGSELSAGSSSVRSMSDLRKNQRESEKNSNPYWNGNSTQFGSKDDKKKDD